jgi:ABC-type multidrug transport system permease subunit
MEDDVLLEEEKIKHLWRTPSYLNAVVFFLITGLFLLVGGVILYY